MTAILLAECIALFVLFACSAFFSSAETALFSLDPIQIHRIRRTATRAADRIERLLAEPTQLLSTILIGNTFVNVVASVVGYAVLERLLPARGIAVAIPTMTLLLLVFGEISPKRLALHLPEKLSVVYSRPLALLTRQRHKPHVAFFLGAWPSACSEVWTEGRTWAG